MGAVQGKSIVGGGVVISLPLDLQVSLRQMPTLWPVQQGRSCW